ncbi:MAG: hypothetical protein ACRYF0_08850 [Janthinobacterium lividum]
MVPTQRGVTTIALLMSPPGGAQDLGNIIPFIRLPPDAQGKEQKPVLQGLYFIINEGKTNNYDLLCQQYTTNPEASGQSPEQLIYVQKSTFTFEVK